MDAPYRTPSAGSSKAASADAASIDTIGTVHGSSVGCVRAAGRGAIRTSSGWRGGGTPQRAGPTGTADALWRYAMPSTWYLHRGYLHRGGSSSGFVQRVR